MSFITIIVITIAIIVISFIVIIGGMQLLMKGATTREEQFQARRNEAIAYNNSLRRK